MSTRKLVISIIVGILLACFAGYAFQKLDKKEKENSQSTVSQKNTSKEETEKVKTDEPYMLKDYKNGWSTLCFRGVQYLYRYGAITPVLLPGQNTSETCGW